MVPATSALPWPLPLGRDVVVASWAETGLIALAKPAGVLSHPNRTGEEKRSLVVAPYDLATECYRWGPGPDEAAWLLNRLDSGTSGVVLLARDAELARQIRLAFKQKHIAKTYLALVFGVPIKSPDVWQDRLAISKQGGQIRTERGGHIPASAAMKVWRSQRLPEPLSLIQLDPRTGRSHQLRVQCAQRRLPIVGDATYGDFRLNRAWAKATKEKRLFLHSFETSFDYEYHGKKHHFRARAELPPAFLSPFAGGGR